MHKTHFKIVIAKLGLILFLLISFWGTNVPFAYSSLESLMFKEDANIVKFTNKLIYNSLYPQGENSLKKSEKNKKDTKKIRVRLNDLLNLHKIRG